MSVATAAPESVTTDTGVEVKVGDFFYASWGYDQTNVDFYKVVGFTGSGKSVRLQKWSQATDESKDGGPSLDYVVPGASPATVHDHSAVTPEMDFWERKEAVKTVPSPVFTKRLSTGYKGGAYISLNSYSSASLWGGESVYQTASGWGH
jgi:hypothetical protein